MIGDDQTSLFNVRYDIRVRARVVNDLLSRSEASDWAAVAMRLSSHMHWEFEDGRS